MSPYFDRCVSFTLQWTRPSQTPRDDGSLGSADGRTPGVFSREHTSAAWSQYQGLPGPVLTRRPHIVDIVSRFFFPVVFLVFVVIYWSVYTSMADIG